MPLARFFGGRLFNEELEEEEEEEEEEELEEEEEELEEEEEELEEEELGDGKGALTISSVRTVTGRRILFSAPREYSSTELSLS